MYVAAHMQTSGLLVIFTIPVRHITVCFHSGSGPTVDLFNWVSAVERGQEGDYRY